MLSPDTRRAPPSLTAPRGIPGTFYFIGLLMLPLLFMLVMRLQPAWDGRLSDGWFHFQVVSFTSLTALVLAVLIGSLAGPVADLRTLFTTFALMAVSGIFLIHGAATPGILFDQRAAALDHETHIALLPSDGGYPSEAALAPALPAAPLQQGQSNAVLAVVWSAPISLFFGSLFFGLATVPWPSRPRMWLLARRQALWWLALGLYALYVCVVVAYPEPLRLLAGLNPISIYTLATLTGLIYAGTAIYFWYSFLKRRRTSDAGLAVAAGLLAEAVISMATMPQWNASWWLYHVLMAVGFMVALGAVVAEYEHARHFNLKRYFAALGVIVTVFLALVAGELASRLFAPLVSPSALTQVRWGTGGLVLSMAALMLVILYQVVRRGDQLLRENAAILQKQQASLERGRVAESLIPIGLAMGATLDLDRVLDTVCEESMRLFAVSGAYLWLKEGNELVGRAGRGHKRNEFIGMRQPLQYADAMGSRMLRERKPLMYNFAQGDPGNVGEVVSQLDARAVLGVPLVANGETLGALMLTHTRSGDQFEPVDLEVATIFGQQAAMALTHARLYATIRRQLYELSTLLAVTTALRQATHQQEVIELLLTQAIKTLNVTGGAVHLIDAEHRTVHVALAVETLSALNGIEYPFGGSLTAHVVESREPDVDDGAEHSWARPAEFQQLTRAGCTILTLPMQAGDRAVGALSLAFPAAHRPAGDDLRLAQTIAEIGGIAIHRIALHETTERQAAALAEALDGLRTSYQATLQALSAALDARDRETEGHSQRVTAYALHLAQAMGITNAETLESLEWGALLHDVGKIGVPDAILLKPGHLTDDEWQQMRLHPETGHSILRDIAFLQRALDVVRHHHERWDGTGYPGKLRGEAIPLAARIFAVADTLDAITTTRPYRAGLSFADARVEIMRHRGLQFDPAVVDAFSSIPDTAWRELSIRLPAFALPGM